VLVSRYNAHTIGLVYGPVAAGEAVARPAVADGEPPLDDETLLADLPQPAATTSPVTTQRVAASRRVVILVILVTPPVAGEPTVDSKARLYRLNDSVVNTKTFW
jgi:hypothetical protein